MNPKSFMLIAGEASGDALGAELVQALRQELLAAEFVPTPDHQPRQTSLEPRFIGAGGPRMAASGVALAFDMTQHSVIGLSEVLKHYLKFRRLFHRLFQLALDHQPEAIICVDFSGFNRRFAHAIQQHVRSHTGWFHDWRPKLIQYVSPQVWASRAGRAYQMARDYDLLLSIFPFERAWYTQRVPKFRVEFVGHPMLDRYTFPALTASLPADSPSKRRLVLLPGSRPGELNRHLPVMYSALALLRAATPHVLARMVLPNESLVSLARSHGSPAGLEVQVGRLPEALASAEIAIASTGTVTMECALFGVPTVALYKTSWSTYQMAKRIVKIKYLSMPNILADEPLFPEFIQDAATAKNIAEAALILLRDEQRRQAVKARLAEIVAALGGPGASRRAAQAVLRVLAESKNAPS